MAACTSSHACHMVLCCHLRQMRRDFVEVQMLEQFEPGRAARDPVLHFPNPEARYASSQPKPSDVPARGRYSHPIHPA